MWTFNKYFNGNWRKKVTPLIQGSGFLVTKSELLKILGVLVFQEASKAGTGALLNVAETFRA